MQKKRRAARSLPSAIIATLIALITVSWAGIGDAAIITVTDQGLPNNINERLTIFTGPTGSPPALTGKSLNFAPMLGDFTSTITKATFLTNFINNNFNVTAIQNNNVVTVTPRPGNFLLIDFSPGKPFANLGGLPIKPEVLNIQHSPADFTPLLLTSPFSLSLSGSPGTGGMAELDLSGPGDGVYTVDNTMGMSPKDVLDDLETQINDNPSKLLSASVVENAAPFTPENSFDLLINNVTTSNDISAIVTDFNYTPVYGDFVPVTEPTSIAILAFGLIGVLWARRQRPPADPFSRDSLLLRGGN